MLPMHLEGIRREVRAQCRLQTAHSPIPVSSPRPALPKSHSHRGSAICHLPPSKMLFSLSRTCCHIPSPILMQFLFQDPAQGSGSFRKPSLNCTGGQHPCHNPILASCAYPSRPAASSHGGPLLRTLFSLSPLTLSSWRVRAASDSSLCVQCPMPSLA